MVESRSVRALSVDPGETSGWCYQDNRNFPDGILRYGNAKNGIMGMMEVLDDWDLEKDPIDVVAIEDFTNYNVKANMGSKNITSQVIGYVKAWCLKRKIKFHMYDSLEIDTFAKHVGMDPRKGAHKDTHWAFACVYGRETLIRMGVAKSALQIQMMKKRK